MENLYWMAYPIRHIEDKYIYYYGSKRDGNYNHYGVPFSPKHNKPDCLICNEYPLDKYKFTCEFAPIINVNTPLTKKSIHIVYEFLKYRLPNEMIDMILNYTITQERQIKSYYLSKPYDIKKLFKCPDCTMQVIKLVEHLCCDKHIMNRLE
jgi:hypothetical protein